MAHDQSLALRTPSSLGRPTPRVAGFGLALVVLAGLPLLPFVIAAPLALAVVLGMVRSTLNSGDIQRALVASAAARSREAQRLRRSGMLSSAGCSSVEFLELERLVAWIEYSDPELAHRLDLDHLLDRHVTLALAHQRAVHAVTISDRVQLQRIRDELKVDPGHDPRRLELCERRLQAHDLCVARVDELADELAVLADMIRLMAQRAACPDAIAPDDAMDQCLSELDGRDAARTALADLQ